MSRQFAVVPAAAVLDRTLSPAHKSVLQVICLHANRDGWCWPELSTIADILGIQKPQVSKMVKGLREAGYLEVHYKARHGKRRCHFRVLYDRPIATLDAVTDEEYDEARSVSKMETLSFHGGNDEFPSRKRSVSKVETPSYEHTSEHTKRTDSAPDGAVIESTKQLGRYYEAEVLAARAVSAGSVVVLNAWNITAERAGFPKARVTPKRSQLIATRMREQGWLDDFLKALAFIRGRDFYAGKNDRGWVATIDYLLQRGKATELAEKAAVSPPPRGPTRSPTHRADADAAWIDTNFPEREERPDDSPDAVDQGTPADDDEDLFNLPKPVRGAGPGDVQCLHDVRREGDREAAG